MKKAEPGKAPGFSEIPGTERTISCELALLAMGFMYPQHNGLLDRLGVDYDERAM